MNKNLKNILNNGEEAYDAQAWKNLSKRLDTVLPVKKSFPFSPKNILIVGASALFIGSGIYFFTNQNEEKNTKTSQNKAQQQIETQLQKEDKSSKEENNSSEKVNEEANSQSNESLNFTQKETEKNSISQNEKEIQKNTSTNFTETNSFTENQKENNKLEEKKIESSSVEFVMPKFEKSYCLNQEIRIKNNNKIKFEILDERLETIKLLDANEQTTLKLNKSGKYYIQYFKENLKQEFIFSVQQIQNVEFTFENEILYDNGVPYIQLKTQDFSPNSKWSSTKGEILEQNENPKLTVFRKGTYEVKLEKSDDNACKSSKIEKIDIKEEYNLLATNAFKPNDEDIRNNSFMPFALTQRNVSFEMLIMNPENGQIIFKSNSADHKWDGTNENTGQKVKPFKSYIWKVSIKNPEPGEKSDYSGTIVSIE